MIEDIIFIFGLIGLYVLFNLYFKVKVKGK